MGFPAVSWKLRELVLRLLRPLFRLGLQSAPVVVGKLRPLAGHGSEGVLGGGNSEDVPPPELWENYADDPAQYLADGRVDMDSVMALLAKHGIAQPRVAMDLGCAAGRMVRHFPRGEGAEVWGADIGGPYIAWCQRNLPGINFVTVSTAPHLPFADGYFDFVFCASVFTHITDLADAWLLEIRRILKPGGHVYLTVHDKVSYRQLLAKNAQTGLGTFLERVHDFERRHRVANADCDMFFFGSDPASQVFYDREFITRKWSRWMELVAYEGQFHNYQSAMLLRKAD